MTINLYPHTILRIKMEQIAVDEVTNFKILPFNIYLKDGVVLFPAGETLTPGKILQLQKLEYIYKKDLNQKPKEPEPDISQTEEELRDSIYSENVFHSRKTTLSEIINKDKLLNFKDTTPQNPSQQEILTPSPDKTFSTNPLTAQVPVIETFDMGFGEDTYKQTDLTIDNIDVSKYRGTINKFSKIEPEIQIKIKAFYNRTIDLLRNVTRSEMVGMFSHIRDKIVQDIVFELQDVEYFSQLKLLGEFSRCHALNTAILSGFIAKRMHIPDSEIMDIVFAGLLHDIGKIQFPKAMLVKKTLTNSEKTLLRRHTIIGYKIIKNEFNLSENIARVALEHHENNDGSGYPASKSGDLISKACQIVSVANYFDRLSSNRTQNKVNNVKDSLKYMLQAGSMKFAPEVLYSFVYMFNFNDVMSFEQMVL